MSDWRSALEPEVEAPATRGTAAATFAVRLSMAASLKRLADSMVATPPRGPTVAAKVAASDWHAAAEEIGNDLKNWPGGAEAARRGALAAFSATDPDSVAVEAIIRSKWDADDWSLTSVALAAYKAGKESAA